MTQLTETVFNDGIAQLAQSSRDISTRFGQQRTVAGQLALIREELAEVLAATSDAHRVEELCDLIVVTAGRYDAAFDVIFAHGHVAKPPLRVTGEGFVCDKELFSALVNFALRRSQAPISGAQIVISHVWEYLQSIPNAAELFTQQVAVVVAKNAAKTADTHYLNAVTGKITRKAVQG